LERARVLRAEEGLGVIAATSRNGHAKVQRTPVVRCAIYTRQSVSDGKDQEFSSLDAQREAAESYIQSQRGRGWIVLPRRYDDGNASGATAERPALQRLLDDVDAGLIDCVVVYKIDRLSRSIADFVALMARFDDRGVAFTAVTQQFDTTSSVGRLTLNLLTCFAQFERETIAERTRDKMHAARKRGKWTGGPPPLGYDVHPDGGKILVNESEAEQVRAIFDLYLDVGTFAATAKTLSDRRWTTKAWTTKGGRERTGARFTRTNLRALLSNPIYIGKTRLKGELFEGEHEAIVERGTFDAAQAMILKNRTTGAGGHRRGRGSALLAGLLRCASCDASMSLAHTTRRGRRYEYYVCRTTRTEGWAACETKSVRAHEIERLVVDQIRAIGKDAALRAEVLAVVREQAADVDEADLERALRLFEPVWEALHAKEQQRVLALLIERIDYDAAAGTVGFVFRPSGIQALAGEGQA